MEGEQVEAEKVGVESDAGESSEYLFVDTPPEDDELRSSLQSFESSLVLLGQKRPTGAVVMLGAAVESAMKRKLQIPSENFIGAIPLLEKFRKHIDPMEGGVLDGLLRAYQGDGPKDENCFRALRNRFVHRGFSPEDDRLARSQWAAVGLPFYRCVLNVDVRSQDDAQRPSDLLVSSLEAAAAAHLNWLLATTEAYLDFSDDRHWTTALLEPWVRWRTRPITDLEEDGDADGVEFNFLYDRNKDYRGGYEGTADLSLFAEAPCPICGSDQAQWALDPRWACQGDVAPEAFSCPRCKIELGVAYADLLSQAWASARPFFGFLHEDNDAWHNVGDLSRTELAELLRSYCAEIGGDLS
jgi:hypothetical protein